MASWSTESATKAYLQTLKMGKRGKEPSVAEFIAALAAGNNAQLMVIVCADVVSAGSTVLALGAAAKETGGHAVCIVPGPEELSNASREVVGTTNYADFIEFVAGDAQALLLEEFQDPDFVLVDCRMEDHRLIMEAGQRCLRRKNGCLVGYNAFHCVFPQNVMMVSDLKTHFLPIGEGLLMATAARVSSSGSDSDRSRYNIGEAGDRNKSRWVVRVDQITGEEHVYRITNKQMINSQY